MGYPSSGVYRSMIRVFHKLPVWIGAPLVQLKWHLDGAPRYQRIRFGGKEFVAGTDRSASYRQLFPEPPHGKTILDVGCNLGYYSLMAASEGARHCCALEQDSQCTQKLAAISGELGLTNLEVVTADICQYNLAARYDIVLLLNVAHHFGSLEQAQDIFDKLYAHALEKMILIVLAPAGPDVLSDRNPKADFWTREHYLRIAPAYFLQKYGAACVKVEPALTYGKNRYVIEIAKGEA